MLKTLKHVWYWLRCHLLNRYHVLNLSRADPSPNGYRWGWCDRDHLMYLACFGLLVDFIEKEAEPGFGSEAYETPESYGVTEPDAQLSAQINRHKEIRRLYAWWTVTRPAEHAAHDKAAEALEGYKGSAWHAWCDEEQRLEEVDDEMLLRLMDVRKSLWT